MKKQSIDTEALLKRITSDPAICHGKPVVRGLRYPVEMILELLSAGMTQQEILDDYPDLEQADILAALAYAARLTHVKHIVPRTMKFLVNAQLPRRVVKRLIELGHDATHTMDLPEGNHTSDSNVNSVSQREHRVLITKDGDFVDSFLLRREPYKLLLISTGNISNTELETLLFGQLDGIVKAFEEYSYLELSRTTLIYHE